MENNYYHQVEAKLSAANTRSEAHCVYLFSEFVDNSLASYIQLSEKNLIDKDYDKSVNIVFENGKGFIFIEDSASGFDIYEKLKFKGYADIKEIEKKTINKNNVGLKDALNTLSKYSLVASKCKGKDLYYCIFSQGFFTSPQIDNGIISELFKNIKESGTVIILFKNFNCLKKYIIENKIIMTNEKYFEWESEEESTDILISKNENSYLSDFTFDIETLLLGADTMNYIGAFLYERYGEAHKKINNFKINFYENVLNYYETRPSEKFSIIKNTKYIDSTSDISKIFTKAKKFIEKYDNESDENKKKFKDRFAKIILILFYAENQINENVKEIKQKINKFYKTGSLEVEIGNNNNEYLNYYDHYNGGDYVLTEYEQFIYNKTIQMFMNSIDNRTISNPVSLKLKFNNISIVGRKMEPSSNLDEKRLFDIEFENYFYGIGTDNKKIEWINFWDEKAKSKPSTKKEVFSGYDIIRNNRAIIHGPNFVEISKPIIKNSPKRHFSREFTGSVPWFNMLIPQDETDKKIASPLLFTEGGGVKWYAGLFGLIRVPNNELFNPGVNKVKLNGLGFIAIDDFFIEYVLNSGVNIMVNIFHSMSSDKIDKKLTSIFDSAINSGIDKDITDFNENKTKNKDNYENIKDIKLDENKKQEKANNKIASNKSFKTRVKDTADNWIKQINQIIKDINIDFDIAMNEEYNSIVVEINTENNFFSTSLKKILISFADEGKGKNSNISLGLNTQIKVNTYNKNVEKIVEEKVNKIFQFFNLTAEMYKLTNYFDADFNSKSFCGIFKGTE